MNEGGGNRRFPPLVTKVPDVGLMVDVGSQSEDRIDQLKQGDTIRAAFDPTTGEVMAVEVITK